MSDIKFGFFTIYHITNHDDVWNYKEKYFEETSDEIIVYEDKWENVEKRFPKPDYEVRMTREIDTTSPPVHAEGFGIKTEEEYAEEHFWDDFDKPKN